MAEARDNASDLHSTDPFFFLTAKHTQPGFIYKVERTFKNIQEHVFGRNNTFQEHFPQQRKLDTLAPIKITKVGAIEHADPLTTHCDDFSQIILLIKLMAAFFSVAKFRKQ